jgi:disulfide bond formation protein DsbB
MGNKSLIKCHKHFIRSSLYTYTSALVLIFIWQIGICSSQVHIYASKSVSFTPCMLCALLRYMFRAMVHLVARKSNYFHFVISVLDG